MGPQASGLAAGGPVAVRDGGHPHPSPPGPSSPDSTSPAQPDYPQSTSQRRINKARLVPPAPRRPPLGRLHIPTAFHTGTVPSLEGHLQELSRVGKEAWG